MHAAAHSDPVGYETLEIFSETKAINCWTFKKISKFTQGRVLEIGSGIGNISGFLLANHSSVCLSDLRQEYCQLLAEKFAGHPHLKGIYLMDLSLPDFKIHYSDLLSKFDTVIALNVIEHIQDDREAIENACALLRSGGRLVVLVPAIPGLFNSLDLHLGHFRRYNKPVLRKLFQESGLKSVSCRYHNAAAIPGWWYSGGLLKEEIIAPGKLRFFNRLVPLFRLLDWLVSPFAGISLITSGIKNIN